MYDAGNPKLVLCANLEGWGGEGGGRRFQDGGDTCIHIDVWRKASQYCNYPPMKINKLIQRKKKTSNPIP